MKSKSGTRREDRGAPAVRVHLLAEVVQNATDLTAFTRGRRLSGLRWMDLQMNDPLSMNGLTPARGHVIPLIPILDALHAFYLPYFGCFSAYRSRVVPLPSPSFIWPLC